MVRNIKVNLQTIKEMAKDYSNMQAGLFMMVNGKMIRLMAMESIFMQKLEQDMKVIGKTICSMGPELKLTHKVINMKECLNKVKETGKESIP